MEADVAGFSERLINCRFERDDAAKEFNPLGLRLRRLRPRQDQHPGESACGLGHQVRECRGEPPPRAAEIGPGEDHARTRDPDADLAGAPDCHQEDIWTCAASRAEISGRDDRRCRAGKRSRVGRKIAENSGGEGAETAPEREQSEICDAILRKASGQDDNDDCADDGADHPEPAFAQRGAKLRLAHDRGGATRPIRVVELEPERDEQGETDGGPQPNGKEQRRAIVASASGRLQLNRNDAALACIVAIPYENALRDTQLARVGVRLVQWLVTRRPCTASALSRNLRSI
jgi:hypothetical protein